MAIDLGTYLPRSRRFEHHTLKEVLLQWILPNDWDELTSIAEVDHESFDLADGDLYDPAQNRPHQRGAIRGFIIEDGTLWPATGAIRTQGGQVVEESFFDETCQELALKRGYARRFPLIEAKGTAATLGHLYRNYYHRWADSIPRLYALYHPRFQELARIDLYIDERFSSAERAVILALAPRNVVVHEVSPATRVCADFCAHLPYLSNDRVGHSKWFNASAGFLPKECLDWLRSAIYDLYSIEPAQPFRKLYVTRRNAKVRRLLNEEAVASYLQGKGFEVVALEKIAHEKQVRLFAEAKTIVAQHGAGLVNLIFAQFPQVVEVCSDKDRQIFFRLISKARGFPHVQLHQDGAHKNEDVVLPIEKLEEGLASL